METARGTNLNILESSCFLTLQEVCVYIYMQPESEIK